MTSTVAMTNAVVIHVTSSTVALSSPRRCRMATFTIDESIAPISVPNVTEMVTTPLVDRRPPFAAGAATGATVPMQGCDGRTCCCAHGVLPPLPARKVDQGLDLIDRALFVGDEQPRS